MWFIVVMHFQMGGFSIVESCNFIKEFVKSCVLFGLCKPIWEIVCSIKHNIFGKGHHVVNGGQYVNQMAWSVDYSAELVNTALESNL